MNIKPIITRMDELLRPLRFYRHKAVWNRKCGPFVDVIDLQKSSFGDQVTINVGVLHPEVHRKCWETQLPAIIQEPECIVRARVGQLINNKDLWWRLDDTGILDDMGAKVSAYALPFLDRMHSFEAMEQFLTAEQVTKKQYPPPVIYLAILKCELGDRMGACTLLTEFGKTTVSGPWKTRINEVAERLGCS